MIKREFYLERKDGMKLYRTFSDRGLMIQKDGTDEVYSEAIDVEESVCTYSETDVPVEKETDAPSVDDTLSMLKELGVDTDDQ